MNRSSQDIAQPIAIVAVVGVGAEQGIGAAVCRRFAQEKFKVYVVGRTLKKVEKVAAAINRQGGQAVAYALDAENEQQVQTLFDHLNNQPESLAAVIHNVGGNIPSIFLQSSLKFFSQMWRSTFLSAVLVAQRSLSIFQKQQQGTLIFTGASASLRGKPFFAAFTMGKSALRSYALNLAELYRPQNIHVAHVVVDGMVDGDRVNKALWGLGRLARLTRGTGGLNIEAIAENYWMLYQQNVDLWTHELDVRPYQEKF
ncbi:SDR family NAD(P)-dependent oxidoreductase [Acinetobacter sp. ANC 3882]|uniref:SDR family NAD(P)-dependent oxidoreductase n=1 Tax=Acinetobacter sp. ANC 3882 TaxID=2923423 RepID=UPI001F4A54DF|nr:SDR family NAD(P)-dependent oxidoreductase [Acinetobacter sp. ANC 3882]MCH7315589.1 SDR family NAD(P)-dependent oxidoreductase [Acinetobacter sp. ANC 3882]